MEADYFMIEMLSKLFRVIIRSGIITSNVKWVLNKRYNIFRNLFFLRYSPLMLKQCPEPELFTKIVATLSIGPTHKTTAHKRHVKVEKIINRFIDKFKKVYLADVGTSDGIASLGYLDLPRIESLFLLDKYTYFDYTKEWYGYNFYNNDGYLVYIQFFNIFLLHIFPILKSKISRKKKGIDRIVFDNPLLKKKGLRITQFDIFKDVLKQKVNILKCANVLNMPYFSGEEIFSAIKNLNKSMLDGGYLFIIQNSRKYKGNVAMVVLKKNKKRFDIMLNYHNHKIYKEVKNRFSDAV